MPARFTDTIKAIQGGLAKMAIPRAVKNIEMWETHVEALEVSGAKGLHGDLGRLKHLLQKEPIDGEAVKKLLEKIAGETARIAGRAEGPRKEQVQHLADALAAPQPEEAEAAKG